MTETTTCPLCSWLHVEHASLLDHADPAQARALQTAAETRQQLATQIRDPRLTKDRMREMAYVAESIKEEVDGIVGMLRTVMAAEAKAS